MAILNVDIPDDLDQHFRLKVFERKGFKKGNIRDAVIEALRMWNQHDTVAELERVVLDSTKLNATQTRALRTLRKHGAAALPALCRIARSGLMTSHQEEALAAIDEITFQ